MKKIIFIFLLTANFLYADAMEDEAKKCGINLYEKNPMLSGFDAEMECRICLHDIYNNLKGKDFLKLVSICENKISNLRLDISDEFYEKYLKGMDEDE